MIRFLGMYTNDYAFTDNNGREVKGTKCDVSFEFLGEDARNGQIGRQGITIKADPARLRFVGKKAAAPIADLVGLPCEYQVDTTKAGKVTEDVVVKIRILDGYFDEATGEFVEE